MIHVYSSRIAELFETAHFYRTTSIVVSLCIALHAILKKHEREAVVNALMFANKRCQCFNRNLRLGSVGVFGVSFNPHHRNPFRHTVDSRLECIKRRINRRLKVTIDVTAGIAIEF